MDKKDFLKLFESLVDRGVFTGFSDDEYEAFYHEKILPILEFLRINPVEGSAPWVLNLEGNQEDFVDFAKEDLLRMHDDYKVGTNKLPALVKNIEEWYKITDNMMHLILGTIRAGTEAVEAKIEQYLEAERKQGFKDGVEKFYVRKFSRDKTLLGRIDGKMSTVEQMKQAAYIDDGWILAQSVWPGVYKDCFKRYLLRERVGFDKCLLNVQIEKFNKTKFFAAKRKYEAEKSYPIIKVTSINNKVSDDRPVKLPIKINKFKEIKIELSDHVAFDFKRNNSLVEGASDIYLMRVYVEPDKEHPDLGNVRNYGMEELQGVVKAACKELEEKIGIVVDYEKITLNKIELNLTFVADGEFEKIAKYVSFYQQYVRAEYKTTEYKTRRADIIKYGDVEHYKKLHLVSTGYVTKCGTIQIKLYDKKEETLEYIRSKEKKAKFELDGKALVRLEYVISNPSPLERYFKETVVCKMAQEGIEKTYRELTKHFFVEPYEKNFVPDSKKTLKKLLEKAAKLASRKKNTGSEKKKRSNWKTELIKDILSEEIWVKTTPALINENDIDREMLPLKSTFSRRPRQYIEEIRSLLKESEIYQKDQMRAYDRLYNFLRKTGDLDGLSKYRRVGYAITDKKKWVNRDNEIAKKEEEVRGIIGDLYNPNNT